MSNKPTSNSFVYFGLIICMVLWGGAFCSTRVLTHNVPPLTISLWRFIIASVFLIILVIINVGAKIKLPTLKQFWKLMILALTGIVGYNYCFVKGMTTVDAGRAAVIISTNPVAISLASAIFLNERLTKLKCVGMLLSLCGVVITLTHGDPLSLFTDGLSRGEIWLLGSMLSWVVYALVGKTLLYELSPLLTTAWSALFGAIIFAFLASSEGGLSQSLNFSLQTWLLLLFVGCGSTGTAFILYHRGIKALGSQKAAAFINLVPVFSLILAYFFISEPIDLSLLLGTALVISGVVLTQKSNI